MGDNGKTLRARLPTWDNSTTWRIRRSLRRFGRSFLRTVRPSCTRRNSGGAHQVISLPTSPLVSESTNRSVIEDKETLNTQSLNKKEMNVYKSEDKIVIDEHTSSTQPAL
ncbi:hypothetical protein I4U23_011733 [Adineta vaga]|nr:hypothetical protein I4U23_011733 [Adineta vaga]